MKETEFTVKYLTRCKECGGEDLSLTATRHDLGRGRVWHLGTVTCLGCGRKVGGLGACEEQAKRAALITWERKNKDDSQEKEPDMKKLYAIRNKETGKIVNDNYGHPHVRRCPEDVFDSRRDELVTLRIEPTEPCEWCEHMGSILGNQLSKINHDGSKETIGATRWNLCPMCGRSLT